MFMLALAIADPPLWLILPFVLMLSAIAVAPIVIGHHWERFYHYVALGLGGLAVLPYVLEGAWPRLGHTAWDYVSFLALIGSLFVVAGGIRITLRGEATPALNCAFLLFGAVIANVVGTTGASMLLIRPWLRLNRRRFSALHTVFFIFLVSNVGGCLTPIGDPPLFLGYLKGVPFWWVAQHCWPAWALGVFTLLGLFWLLDRAGLRRSALAAPPPALASDPVAPGILSGAHNLLFLALIVGAVFLKSPVGLRELLMAAAAIASWSTTPRALHEANDFTFTPIREVAWLFAGIFATMMPALDYLERHAATLGLHTEQQYYWLTGALSGVLDNAPTYLAFLASAFGLAGLSLDDPAHVRQFADTHAPLLQAISLGAVVFGAMTYLGNGPNLMVKSIVEAAGLQPPNFLRYTLFYGLPILLPVCALIALLLHLA